MAPPSLRKLTALQSTRFKELEVSSSRLREKPRDALTLAIVRARITGVSELWTEARSTHADIMARDEGEEDFYFTDGVFPRLQALYEDTLDFLLGLQSDLEQESTGQTPPRGESLPGRGLDEQSSRAKLPRLELPTFSGRCEDWENFCDLFTTLVHNVPSLAEATKLQYLKTCLRGSAADLVKEITTTNANYASTWQALRARFHNPRLVVHNHLRALFDLGVMKRECAEDLRHLVDESQRINRALNNLGMPVESWDIWFVFIIAARLDPDSRKAWETRIGEKERQFVLEERSALVDAQPLNRFPTFAELVEFMEGRAQSLGMIASETRWISAKAAVSSKPGVGARKVFHSLASPSSASPLEGKPICPLCAGPHRLFKCYKFKSRDPRDRRSEVRRLQLCYNCFGNHRVLNCPSNLRCSSCREKHHSMIHGGSLAAPCLSGVPNRPDGVASNLRRTSPARAAGANSLARAPLNTHTASFVSRSCAVLLATAQVNLLGAQGASVRIRVLIDQGSEASFISDKVASLLGLRRRRVDIPLVGLGASSVGSTRGVVEVTIQSLTDPSFKLEAEAFILPKLTSQLPARRLMKLDLSTFAGLELADPLFHRPDSVDAILGADMYGRLLRPGIKRFPASLLVAQDTFLGWIVSGPVSARDSRRAEDEPGSVLRTFFCADVEKELNDSLLRFWSLEEVPTVSNFLKPHEEACETHFAETHSCDARGRYVVRLPLKPNLPLVGSETRRMALGSLAHSHRRFSQDAKLASAYREFMTCYEELGHMERIPAAEIHSPQAWYLPHHAVVQSTPMKWKLRVVFDASRKTRDQHCLNDFLWAGPALQRDLALILLNWRQYRWVFTADIVKMFRPIRVAPADQDLQRVVWSPDATGVPVDYRLTTVTYGTACAPYLAIRTLLQLAEDKGSQFPLGARCLTHFTYVDDTFAGANSLSDALAIWQELIQILQSAGIVLDKWAANHLELLPSHIASSVSTESCSISLNDPVKTLGISWNPSDDEFNFSAASFKELGEVPTKRSVLSEIARLIDPLGWIAPVVVTAKILMQDLWILKGGWDDPLPGDLQNRWGDYRHSLSELSALSIGRWLESSPGSTLQLHGFSDASSRAYAAAIYLRSVGENGSVRVALLTAKSKVAPVKSVSIPNLELCGAVLLVKLFRRVQGLDWLRSLSTIAWTDSQIVLCWLRKHPSHWKTFVANRVSYIQTELPGGIWGHVPTKENPADLATRGCRPSELKVAALWWRGPEWLLGAEGSWPKETACQGPTVRVCHARRASFESRLAAGCSTWTKLIRCVAYCLRPLYRLRRRRSGDCPLPEFLTAVELANAQTAVIRVAQAEAFAIELGMAKRGVTLPKSSPLAGLAPFLDLTEGVLRVGGRLGGSVLPLRLKHPPIMPRRSVLSRLLVRYAHRRCLHGGTTLTLCTLIQYAWIVGRTRLVKTEIRCCIPCQRVRPRLAHQMMGKLPAARVNPARPFTHTGLDYAGPFAIRTTKGRGFKTYKGYVVLFVCFATRAIHLEVASDLSTRTFLAAFRRFTGRRGICKELYSDNATTFQAADKELRAMFKAGSSFFKEAAGALAEDGTSWKFIPPNAPHYGGLWEAGVKSVKHHLKRAFGDRPLTFEEFSTVLVEIEACLNSRPLCPLTSDIEDLRVLTPAHFLLGEASGLVPDEAPPDVPEGKLDRYHLLVAARNGFWKRWSAEYLQHLQERGKWRQPMENFAVGQLVLLRDDRYPPAKWPLGRVVEVHPGQDGLVRVVSVKTAMSKLRRHVARLCPLILPTEGSASQGV